MAHHELIYGTQEIRLHDDEDVAALRQRVQEISNQPDSRWLEVRGQRDTHWLFITPGVPLRLVRVEPATGHIRSL